MKIDPEAAGPNIRGWVLYDGECAFCTKWITSMEPLLERHGFATEALQAQWVAKRLKIPAVQLLDDIRLLKRDGAVLNGAVLNGADAYLFVMRQIGWAWPLYALF